MAFEANVNVLSNSSGFAPFTVLVNTEGSDFNGHPIEDMEFVWDFGDSDRPLNDNKDNERYYSNENANNDLDIVSVFTNKLVTGNYKNKTRFSVPTIDSDTDNTGYSKCSGDSNSNQRGSTAAYTYYHAGSGSFKITLKIFYKGQEVAESYTNIIVQDPIVYNSWSVFDITDKDSSINQIGSYVSLKINPNYTGPGQDEIGNPECNSFSSLNNALAWCSGYHQGYVRFVFVNDGSVFDFSELSQVVIDYSNLVFTVSDCQYLNHFTLSPNYLVGENEPFIVINGNNIYFENIIIKGNTSSYNASYNGIECSIDSSDICFHNCSFYNFNKAIIFNGYRNYLNKIICKPNNDYLYKSCFLEASGIDGIVITGLEIIGDENYRTLYEKENCVIDIRSCTGITLQWSYVDCSVINEYNYKDSYGFLYNNQEEISSGSFFFGTNVNCSILSNCFINSCNEISNCFNVRISGNYFSGAGGGQKEYSDPDVIIQKRSCLYLNNYGENYCIVSNVFELKDNNMLCSAISLSDNIKLNIKISSNLFILWSNLSKYTAVCDFHVTNKYLTNFEFMQNLFVENKLNCVSNYISYNTEQTNSTIKDNILPKPKNLKNVRCCVLDGNNLDCFDFDLYSGYYYYNIEIEDCRIERGFSLDSEKYNDFPTFTIPNYVNSNYKKEFINSDIISRSYASSFVSFSDDGSSFDLDYSVISRNRESNPNATINDSHNFSLEIRDPLYSERDDVGVYSDKIIIGKSYERPSYEQDDYVNLLNGVGDYIKTTISFEEFSDGIDIVVTYLNDGPDSQILGSSYQKMGTIDIDGIFAGRNFSLLSDVNGFGLESKINHLRSDFDTTIDNICYPQNKFSSVTCYSLKNHAVVISLLADFSGKDKLFQEIIKSKSGFNGFIFSRGHLQIKWIPNAYSEISYYNDCLQKGESFSIKISIKITRNPTRWIEKTRILKDYLNQSIIFSHTKDPRPIFLENLVSNDGESPLYMNPTYNIKDIGYVDYVDSVVQKVINKKFSRYILFNPIGYNYEGMNPYPQIFTPLYKTMEPWNNYSAMLSSIQDIQRIGEELPQFGFYQGYSDIILTNNFSNSNAIYDSIDFLDSNLMQKFYDEMDLAVDNFWPNIICLGSLGNSFNYYQMKNSIRLIDTYKQRYPNVSFFVEGPKQDVYLFRSASSFSSYNNVFSPHHLANYLVPGNEIWFTDYGILNFDENLTQEEYLYRFKIISDYGYNISSYNFSDYDDFVAYSSEYISRDRRFDFEEIPEDFTEDKSPAKPTNIRYGLYNKERNITYSTSRKYIKLFWDHVTDSDFSHYIIYKCNISNQSIDSSPSNFVTRQYSRYPFFYDTAARVGKTYYYQISSVDVFGNESEKTDILTVPFVENDSLPEPPSSINIVNGTNSVIINWS